CFWSNRGVDVKIVIDKEGNTNTSRVAINLVTNAGIELRTDDNYKIQHDKVMIIDDNSTDRQLQLHGQRETIQFRECYSHQEPT
ncbi:TPA: hypothetical protein ACF5HI_004609, partial [Salmonella enterica]